MHEIVSYFFLIFFFMWNMVKYFILSASVNILELRAQLKRKWEVELDTEFSEDTWQSVLNNIYSSSICLKQSRVSQIQSRFRS